MAHVRLDQTVSHHGVEEFAAQFQSVPPEHAQIELKIVPDLFNSLRFEGGAQFLQDKLCLGGIFRDRNIVATVLSERKSQAHQAPLLWISTIRLQGETKGIFAQQSG